MGTRSGTSDVACRVKIKNENIKKGSSLFSRGSLISRRFCVSAFLYSACLTIFPVFVAGQSFDQLSIAIRTGTTEQKRDALFQIRKLKSEIASRSALPALDDPDPIVRATAAASVAFLPKAETLAALAPMLGDKDAFVRKEAAYALGATASSDAAASLVDLLRREKDLEVKAAATIALGQTGNSSAVEPLLAILKRSPVEDEEFLRRSAARSIGQIAQIIKTTDSYVVTPQNFLSERFKKISGDDLTAKFPVFGAAIVTLGSVLQAKSEASDTRREAAFALGSIGSRSAASILQARTFSNDPYLAEVAKEALLKLAN